MRRKRQQGSTAHSERRCNAWQGRGRRSMITANQVSGRRRVNIFKLDVVLDALNANSRAQFTEGGKTMHHLNARRAQAQRAKCRRTPSRPNRHHFRIYSPPQDHRCVLVGRMDDPLSRKDRSPCRRQTLPSPRPSSPRQRERRRRQHRRQRRRTRRRRHRHRPRGSRRTWRNPQR